MDFLTCMGTFCFYLMVFVIGLMKEEKGKECRVLFILITIVLTIKYPAMLFEHWGVSEGLSFFFEITLALFFSFLGRVTPLIRRKLCS